MHTAIAITLLFVAATSALGGLRNLRMGLAAGAMADYLGAAVAIAMTAWCTYLSAFILIGRLA